SPRGRGPPGRGSPVSGGVLEARRESARSDSACYDARPGRSPVTASYREQPESFPYVDSTPQYTPQSRLTDSSAEPREGNRFHAFAWEDPVKRRSRRSAESRPALNRGPRPRRAKLAPIRGQLNAILISASRRIHRVELRSRRSWPAVPGRVPHHSRVPQSPAHGVPSVPPPESGPTPNT